MSSDIIAAIRKGIEEGTTSKLGAEELKADLRLAKAELLKEACEGLNQLSGLVKADSPFGTIEFSAPEVISYSYYGEGNYYSEPEVFADAEPLPRELETTMRINRPGCYPPTEPVRIEIREDQLRFMSYTGEQFRKDTEPLLTVELTEQDLLSAPIRQEKVAAFVRGVAKTAAQHGYNFAD